MSSEMVGFVPEGEGGAYACTECGSKSDSPQAPCCKGSVRERNREAVRRYRDRTRQQKTKLVVENEQLKEHNRLLRAQVRELELKLASFESLAGSAPETHPRFAAMVQKDQQFRSAPTSSAPPPSATPHPPEEDFMTFLDRTLFHRDECPLAGSTSGADGDAGPFRLPVLQETRQQQMHHGNQMQMVSGTQQHALQPPTSYGSWGLKSFIAESSDPLAADTKGAAGQDGFFPIPLQQDALRQPVSMVQGSYTGFGDFMDSPSFLSFTHATTCPLSGNEEDGPFRLPSQLQGNAHQES